MPTASKPGKRARPKNREVEYEDLRPPSEDGKPPRPATEPPGAPEGPFPGDVRNDPRSGKPVR